MSSWFVRSVLALLLSCFGMLAHAAVSGEPVSVAAVTVEASDAVVGVDEPASPSEPAPSPEPAAVVDLADDRLHPGEGAQEPVDLFVSLSALRETAGSLATPDGWNGLSSQSPYLSKLRRPPRALLS